MQKALIGLSGSDIAQHKQAADVQRPRATWSPSTRGRQADVSRPVVSLIDWEEFGRLQRERTCFNFSQL
jgi:hypothetical protein